MTIIKAYTFTPQVLGQENGESAAKWKKRCVDGGFNPHSKKFTPFTEPRNFELHHILDALTAAAEAGILDTETWVTQAFGTLDAAATFMDMIEGYDYFRIYDRWYRALFWIAMRDEEEEFVSTYEIAEGLRSAVVETGQN